MYLEQVRNIWVRSGVDTVQCILANPFPIIQFRRDFDLPFANDFDDQITSAGEAQKPMFGNTPQNDNGGGPTSKYSSPDPFRRFRARRVLEVSPIELCSVSNGLNIALGVFLAVLSSSDKTSAAQIECSNSPDGQHIA